MEDFQLDKLTLINRKRRSKGLYESIQCHMYINRKNIFGTKFRSRTEISDTCTNNNMLSSLLNFHFRIELVFHISSIITLITGIISICLFSSSCIEDYLLMSTIIGICIIKG